MKRKSQRYWVETQARDGGWSPVIRNTRRVYLNCSKPQLGRIADNEIAFMRRILQYAKKKGIGILAARVMQVDPNGVENLYHTEKLGDEQ